MIYLETSQTRNDTYITDFPEVNCAEINLTRLKHNMEILKRMLSPETKFMAVLKADAYGHGLIPIAKELEVLDCDAFGIVRLSEGIGIRNAGIGKPLILLTPVMPNQAEWVLEYDITPMVDNERILEALERTAANCGRCIHVHVKVNTGLNRYGVSPDNACNFIEMIHGHFPHINIEGIYTHFRDAEFNPDFTKMQIELFNSVLRELEVKNLRPPLAHAAGSAGIMMYPESHYDMTRCGIILYGIEHKEGENLAGIGIEPLMSLKSRILKIQEIKSGQSGGYGNNFIAPRDSIVALIGIGYGDGVSRGWKEVLIAGHRVPVVNYFMDGIMADITDITNPVHELDEVVIVGSQGEEVITWEEACRDMGANADEQFQRITERVPKIYFYDV